ncbi:nuclear nucleic acid-binding protein C1D-like [Pseudomyrmex gracilis]|uniref:nuclear nucleic acid-binding protein C1D-like n=1 Tax=Pseudomyrmex gracilis TaxID=219809 RepID=UPI0009957D19|nr:nuclear nucleic acid-binding protein C1D-like [Pseudomyrmex gracilis]
MNADFEELSHDENLIARLQQFGEAAFKIQDMIELINNPSVFEKLSNSDKINYKLLLSYSLNSLFWMYLRAEGKDPSKHRIKSENERLKKAMLRAKQISDRKLLMPRVNKDAAKRFVRSSLWEPNQKKQAIEKKTAEQSKDLHKQPT